MKKLASNRGCVISLILGAFSCYLVYILWFGHSQRNYIKSIIINAIDDSFSVDTNQEALRINDRRRNLWYEV